MGLLILLIWAAGAVHVAILAANFALPEKIRCRENLSRVSPRRQHRVGDVATLFAIGFLVCVFGFAAFAGPSR